MKIMGNTPDQLIRFVENGITDIQRRFGFENDCGYFAVVDCATGDGILLICQIGINPPNKREKRFLLCQEKALRLLSNPQHFLSSQSRVPDELKYSGAVRAGGLILSFAGLPEEYDEPLMVYVAYWAKLLTKNEALELAVLSRNEHICEII